MTQWYAFVTASCQINGGLCCTKMKLTACMVMCMIFVNLVGCTAADNENAAPALAKTSFASKAKHYIAQHVERYKVAVGVAHAQLFDEDFFEGQEEDYPEEGEEEDGVFWENERVNSSEVGMRRRSKRATIFQDRKPRKMRPRRRIDHESEGTFVINALERGGKYFEDNAAIDINCQRVKDKTFVFSIEPTANGNEVRMHQLNDQTLDQMLLNREKAPGAISVDVFTIQDQLYAFTTVNHDPHAAESPETINTGSALYKVINPSGSNWIFDKTQTIHLPFAKSSTVWTGMGNEVNQLFLALAPEKAVVSKTQTSYSVTVPVYRWQGGYFDWVSQLPATNPQSIQHFTMFSHDYLVVANYQDDTGSTSVQSEIFKYNHKENQFVSFQRVQTYGAKDIKHFTFSSEDERRQEHFIAIANSCKMDESGKPQYWVQSTIMKFGNTRFLPFKSFNSYGAQQFLPVQDGKRFFLAYTDFHGMRVFQYNGWTFVETYSKRFEGQHDVSHPFSISMRELNGVINGRTYFTVASNNQNVENGMFGATFETRNDHRKLVTSVEAWCNGAKKLVTDNPLDVLEARLNSAPKLTDSRVIIRGELKFNKGLEVGELKSQSLRLGRGRNLDQDKFKEMAKMERDFKGLTDHMDFLDRDLTNNVVYTNSDNLQEITSRVHFNHDFVYKNEQLDVRHLTVNGKMGSAQVTDHLDNAIYMDEEQVLESIVTDKVIVNDADVSILNGHPLSDYALLHPSKKQTFTGANEFQSGVQVSREIQVGKNFAGLSLTQPEFLLYGSNQTFAQTTMQLDQTCNVENLYTRMVNGVDVFTMFHDAVSLSGGVIKAEKQFVNADRGVEIKNAKVTKINDEDISDMYNTAIYVTGKEEQTFLQPVYFESLAIEDITPVDPMINDQFDVNVDFYKIAGHSYNLNSMKFEKSTQINDLFVKRQLNDVKVLENGRLDLLLQNSDQVQHIKNKRLESVHFTQHTAADRLVDGMHLAGWSNVMEIELTENEIQGAINLPEGFILAEEGIFVDKSFQQSNQDVMHVLQHSARLDSETLGGSCKTLQFDNLEVKGNSDIRGRVNSVKPSQWVVNSGKATQLDITAKKVFTGPVHLNSDVGANALYGQVEDSDESKNLLKVFPTLLLDGKDQVITNEMAFGGNFRADQATCPNAILDKVPFEHLLLKRGDQTVEVDTVFRQPFGASGDVNVAQDLTTTLVNGLHINNQLKNTLMTSGQETQIVKGNWQFDKLEVTEGTQVMGHVASSDVESLYGNIVRKDSEVIQLSGANLEFAGRTEMDRVEFIGRLNDIPSTEWGHAWLLSRTDQVVETKVEFAGPVNTEAFSAPTVNGVNINQLSENIVRIDRDEVVKTSAVNFKGPVNAQSGIDMPNGANVNGIDLSKDVLLKNSAKTQTVTGDKTFKNGANVKGNLFVNELSGFDINNFANLVNRQVEGRASLPTSSLRIKGDLKMEQEPEVTTSVNGQRWDDILQNTWMRGEDVVFENPVEFNKLSLQQGGIMEKSAKLNGLDLEHFENNYASKSRPQKWTGQVTLNTVENVEKLTANSLENNGKFNGENLQEFYDSVLTYSKDQEIVADSFEAENVEVERLDGIESNGGDLQINKVSVKNDLMTTTGPNIVTVQKKIKNLKAQSLVLSENTVMDGVNLGEWKTGAVTRTGSEEVQEIQGPLLFESLETTQNVVVDGVVDQMKFDLDNVLTTDKDQVVPNKVTIRQKTGRANRKKSPVLKAADIEFKGKLNGIDVENSLSKMVFKDEVEKSTEPIVIKTGTIFNAPLILNQVRTENLIHGQDVTALMTGMARAHEEVHNKAFLANEQYSQLLSMTKRMLSVSEKRACFLDYYVLTQTIKMSSTYVKVLREVGYPAIAIGFKQSDRITTEHWWSYSAAVDYYQLQIGNRVQLEGMVTDIAELADGQTSIFAFAVNNEASDRPAQAALETIDSNNVQNVEINKSPDKLSKTFILKNVDVGTANMRPAISQVIYSHGFKSVKSFKVTTGDDSLTSCMAAATDRNNEMDSSVKIFCLDKISGALETVQEMNLESPSLMTTTTAPDAETTLLAILTHSDKTQTEGLLEVWSHTMQFSKGATSIQFSRQSCLPALNAASLDSLTTHDGKTFMTVATRAIRGSVNKGTVVIYRYSVSELKFKKVQTIEVNHPLDAKLQWLEPSNELVVYVLSDEATNNVQVYKRQGLSGWSRVHQFTSENGQSLNVADFTEGGVYRAQVLVTSPTETNVYAAEFMGMNTVIEEELMETSQMKSINGINARFLL